ncbi:MAG: hypothetical protein KZQ77_12560, partial [Candidatus Thiodiazotropha sp. (ex Notomyrtea botanica)]|nr:hypothetical protein [Candidatus Thiodiazotropha sp. (ex Notomyrtea botanica)]
FQKQLSELIKVRNTPGLGADQIKELDRRIQETQQALATLSQGRIEADKLFAIDKRQQERVVSEFIRDTLQAIDAGIAEATGSSTDQQFNLIREKFAALQAEIADFATPVQRLRVFQDEITRIGAAQATQLQEINARRSAGLITEREQVLAVREANAAYQEQLTVLASIARTQGFEFLAKQIEKTAEAVQTTSADIQVLGEEINRNFVSGFTNAFEEFIKGTLSAKDAFRAFAADFLRQIAQMILQKQILSAIGGRGFGGAVAAAVAHTGGVSGSFNLGSRTVPGWVFSGATKLHTGTFPGLKPNEVPTIIEEGEGIFTADQMKAMGGKGSGGASSVRVVLVDDRSSVGDYMSSSEGEKIFIETVRRNKSTVKKLING